jgi:gamma-glutamyltranspeptidase
MVQNLADNFPHSTVTAKNMVATSQPLAVEAGLDTMKRGGNAVDAALAAAVTLTVVEPTGCGLGSDAFAIIWDGSEPRHQRLRQIARRLELRKVRTS